jgi:thiol:disulfide interchange protein
MDKRVGLRLGILSLASVFVAVPVFSADSPAGKTQVETPHARVELVSEFEATAPGATQWIGIHFKPEEGWHVYWKNPGDSGLPPRVEFSSNPEDSTFGKLEFPTPDRIPYGPLVNYGYHGEVLYPAKWTAPSGLSSGESITITANLKWLICKEECVPGKANLSLTLPVGPADVLKSSSGTHTPHFKEAVSSLTQEAPGKIRLVLSPDGSQVEIAFHGPEVKKMSKAALASVFFFPEGEYGIGAEAAQVATATPDGIKLVIPRKEKKPVGEIRGVLKIAEGKSFQVAEVIDPKLIPAKASTRASAPGGAAPTSLGLMLLFAFIGGIILNLMPCILPVLSIKVLGLANQAGSDRSAIRRHGVVFTFGIFVSFWILAGILLAVRASGQSLGWGFQLQDPIFVASLAILFFMMALNLFGVFEVGDRWMGFGGNLAAKEGYAGSFFTGVLTTVAATPCSAPFMGSALGFALTQSAFIAVLVLTVLAFGLAFPYLVFSFLPAAARILPRPGAWMKTLKEFMAFPLLATVVWLVGVAGIQSGQGGIEKILVTLLLFGIVAWLIGKFTNRPLTTFFKWVTILASLVFSVSILSSLGKSAADLSSKSSSHSPLVHTPWQEWTPEAQAKAIADGKTVLVNFTAEWCVTCRVNESVVFKRDAAVKALSSDSVVALLADWTNSDERITNALSAVGRNSVPVYLLYKPGRAEPKILPQILTLDSFLGELR